jgi:CO/xanthine dehydrogenase FAD-binding subunit
LKHLRSSHYKTKAEAKHMLTKLAEYHWVEHIDDALLLLGRLDTRTVPLAGGTYLLGLSNDSIQAVVDLRDLPLNYISEDQQGIHIGAMTTLQTLVEASVPKEYAAGLLSRAAQASASSHLIRNSATIGGTVAIGVASQADLLTALAALDAQVLVRSGSRTEVNLGGGTTERPGLALSGVIFKGKHERRLPSLSYSADRRPGELIIEIILPKLAAGCGASFARVARIASDVALLNVATVVEIEDGTYRRVRLALGGVNMEPVRMGAVERALQGQPVGRTVDIQLLQTALREGLGEVRFLADARVSSGYRRICATSLAAHALEEAVGIAQWRGVMSSD